MRAELILPTIVMLISAAAGVVYLAAAGDWRRAGYWLAAAAITFFATF